MYIYTEYNTYTNKCILLNCLISDIRVFISILLLFESFSVSVCIYILINMHTDVNLHALLKIKCILFLSCALKGSTFALMTKLVVVYG